MTALLVHCRGNTRVFTGPFSIGRRGADLLIDDDYVSPIHALFRPDGLHWDIEDNGSTNGTRVNGATISRNYPLVKGDQVTVGRTTFTVVPV